MHFVLSSIVYVLQLLKTSGTNQTIKKINLALVSILSQVKWHDDKINFRLRSYYSRTYRFVQNNGFEQDP